MLGYESQWGAVSSGCTSLPGRNVCMGIHSAIAVVLGSWPALNQALTEAMRGGHRATTRASWYVRRRWPPARSCCAATRRPRSSSSPRPWSTSRRAKPRLIDSPSATFQSVQPVGGFHIPMSMLRTCLLLSSAGSSARYVSEGRKPLMHIGVRYLVIVDSGINARHTSSCTLGFPLDFAKKCCVGAACSLTRSPSTRRTWRSSSRCAGRARSGRSCWRTRRAWGRSAAATAPRTRRWRLCALPVIHVYLVGFAAWGEAAVAALEDELVEVEKHLPWVVLRLVGRTKRTAAFGRIKVGC